MKKYIPHILTGLMVMFLAGMFLLALFYEEPSGIISGTEGVHYGMVEDLAMDSIAEARWEWEFDWRRKQEHRPYISAGGECFWAPKGHEEGFGCSIGDYVKIEYGIEVETELLVATRVTVLEE